MRILLNRHRIARGAVAQIGGQVFLVVQRLIELPIYIAYWGIAVYGDWLMIAVVPTYLSFADFGLIGAANREMVLASATNDFDRARRLFWQSILVSLLMLVILSIAGYYATEYVRQASSAPSHLTISERRNIYWILSSNVAFAMVARACYGLYMSSGRYPLGLLGLQLLNASDFVAMTIAVIAGMSIVESASTAALARFIATVMYAVHSSRTCPWIQKRLAIKKIFRAPGTVIAGLAAQALSLSTALTIQGSVLIIGAAFGPATAAVFVAHRTFPRLQNQLINIVGRIFQPELALGYGGEGTKRWAKLSVVLFSLAIWVTALSALLLFAMTHIIFPLWSHGQVQFEPILFTLLLVDASINALWSIAIVPYVSINSHLRIAYRICLLTILFVLILWPTTLNSKLTLNQFATAMLIYDLTMLLVIAINIKNDTRVWPLQQSLSHFMSLPIDILHRAFKSKQRS